LTIKRIALERRALGRARRHREAAFAAVAIQIKINLLTWIASLCSQ